MTELPERRPCPFCDKDHPPKDHCEEVGRPCTRPASDLQSGTAGKSRRASSIDE
jgi:hypothetical protein